MGKEISHFIIHFLILNVLTMTEDIVERFNRSYRNEVLDCYLFNNLNEVRQLTDDWINVYNHERPHTGLDGKMIKPHPQEPDGEIMEFSRLGGLLKSYRRVKVAVNE